MKTYLGIDANGQKGRMRWSGTVKELVDATPEIVWYAVIDDEEEDIRQKAEALGIRPELYKALQLLGAA